MEMFINGVDQGYKELQDWWSNPVDPDHYRIASLEEDYPLEYFPQANPGNAIHYVNIIINYYKELTGKKLDRIVEFGSAGGWYLKEFIEHGLQVQGYEGSLYGIQHCHKIGIEPNQIELKDFRFPIERRYRMADLAICTEVAEHLEPPFHGTLVHSLVNHSTLVWFSSEEPNTNKPHLSHPGEMPLDYWKSLFAFFGYGCHMLSDDIYHATAWRGRCIFFKKSVHTL